MTPRLALALALLTAPSLTRAQTATPAVEALFTEGVRLREARRDADALDRFVAAWELCRCPEALAQRALAEQALARWADADAHLRDALSHPDDPWIARHRDALTLTLSVVAAHLGDLTVTAPPGTRVAVDGRASTVDASGELTLRLPVGRASLSVDGPAVEPRTYDVDVVNPTSSALSVPPSPRPAPPPAPRPAPARAAARAAAPWLALGGGALLAGALSAQVTERVYTAAYADDARCLAGGRTRDENCSALRETSDTARALAVTGWVAGGVTLAVAAGLWLFAPRERAALSLACAPSLTTPGAACALRF